MYCAYVRTLSPCVYWFSPVNEIALFRMERQKNCCSVAGQSGFWRRPRHNREVQVNEQGRFTGLCSQCREGTTHWLGQARSPRKIACEPTLGRGSGTRRRYQSPAQLTPESVSAPLQTQAFSADWPVKVGLNPSPPSLSLAIAFKTSLSLHSTLQLQS